MDEQKVRDAVRVANEIADINTLGLSAWVTVLNALVSEPPAYTEQKPIERFLGAVGGSHSASSLKQTDPDFFRKLCEHFGIEL